MLTTDRLQSGCQLLEFDDAAFEQHFPRRGFKIRHHISDHPAFQLPRLAELAGRLPECLVEFYAGDVPISQDLKNCPRNGLSPAETVRRIENCGSWMVLKNVGIDPEYAELLRTALDEVAHRLGPAASRMRRSCAFIFVSSPQSITPFHLDDEHNFLLQIRGTKQVSMWGVDDRVVMPEQQAEHMLECYHSDDWQRNMEYRDDFQKRAAVFELAPGDGLHFPFGAPHWVKNGPQVSISFSITWLSEQSDRTATLYHLNKKFRRLGLRPTPPGQSPWRDSLKLTAFQAGRLAARVLRRIRPGV